MEGARAHQDEIRCPRCGGQTAFAPEASALVCQSCGFSQDLKDEMEHHCEIGVRRIKDGEVGEGLHRIAHGLDRGLGLSERVKRLHTFLTDNREAQTEIFSTEDPQAVLGVFFGLAGLIRNGELPEQFRKR